MRHAIRISEAVWQGLLRLLHRKTLPKELRGRRYLSPNVAANALLEAALKKERVFKPEER
jgi:hypothetical protein